MLEISQKSQDVFVKQSEERFRECLMFKIQVLPEKNKAKVNDYGNDKFIDEVISSAQHYDIKYEKDIAAWFSFLVSYGTKFPLELEHQWALEILDDQDYDGEQKIESLLSTIEDSAPEE